MFGMGPNAQPVGGERTVLLLFQAHKHHHCESSSLAKLRCFFSPWQRRHDELDFRLLVLCWCGRGLGGLALEGDTFTLVAKLQLAANVQQ